MVRDRRKLVDNSSVIFHNYFCLIKHRPLLFRRYCRKITSWLVILGKVAFVLLAKSNNPEPKNNFVGKVPCENLTLPSQNARYCKRWWFWATVLKTLCLSSNSQVDEERLHPSSKIQVFPRDVSPSLRSNFLFMDGWELHFCYLLISYLKDRIF